MYVGKRNEFLVTELERNKKMSENSKKVIDKQILIEYNIYSQKRSKQ